MYDSIEIFSGVDQKDMEGLLTCLSAFTKSYDKNEIVLMAGQETEHIGILLSGELHIIKEDIYGNKTILTSINENGMFAESFVCAEMKHSPVTVIATKRSNVLFISINKILITCNSSCYFHNKLIFNLVSILANKNILLNKKIDYLTAKTIKKKIAKYLINSIKDKHQEILSIPYNRNELAEFLGVNRSVLSRELSLMKRENILDFNKNEFHILNHKKLSQISQ